MASIHPGSCGRQGVAHAVRRQAGPRAPARHPGRRPRRAVAARPRRRRGRRRQPARAAGGVRSCPLVRISSPVRTSSPRTRMSWPARGRAAAGTAWTTPSTSLPCSLRSTAAPGWGDGSGADAQRLAVGEGRPSDPGGSPALASPTTRPRALAGHRPAVHRGRVEWRQVDQRVHVRAQHETQARRRGEPVPVGGTRHRVQWPPPERSATPRPLSHCDGIGPVSERYRPPHGRRTQ